ncbi:hypothetical protein RQP46_009795 [Phenoliferia psychrophenolica]
MEGSPPEPDSLAHELEDVALSPPASPSHAPPPESPSSPTAPPRLSSSPPPFQFPTAEEAKAYHANGSEMIVQDDDGAFESVALGDSAAAGGAHGWSATRRSPADERAVEEEAQPAAAREEEEERRDATPEATPPLSESTSSAAATTSEVTLPAVEEGVAVDPTSTNGDAPVLTEKPVFVPTPTKKGVASILQKTVSMTRQRDLPPKDREQERKHLRELEEMRAAAKEADRRRASNTEMAAAARAAVLASALPSWESSILPNWRVVLHEDAKGKALRRLWWDGTMPVRWRGRLWGLCVGNGLAVSRNAYATCLLRAQKGQSEGRYPGEEWEALLEDVEMTLPTLKIFHKEGGVMHEELVDILLAYTVYWGGQPRYPRGLSYTAGMLLLNMPAVDAFLTLVNLVNKSFLKSFFSDSPAEVDAYYRIFDTLLADTMPKVYANFSHEVVRPKLYLHPWLTSTFVRFLPLDLATRIFDVFLLEGDSFLFRVALVVLQILEPRLFNPVLAELDAVFKGLDREVGKVGVEGGDVG